LLESPSEQRIGVSKKLSFCGGPALKSAHKSGGAGMGVRRIRVRDVKVGKDIVPAGEGGMPSFNLDDRC